jgi:uncharacterized coiled-coil protein SlyX
MRQLRRCRRDADWYISCQTPSQSSGADEGHHMMHDDALEKIETKIAFLERGHSELSDVVFRQQRVIDALRTQVATLAARMQVSQDADATPQTPEDERPPHY